MPSRSARNGSGSLNIERVIALTEIPRVCNSYHQTTDVDLTKALELSLGGLNLTEGWLPTSGLVARTLIRARRAARLAV